MPFTLKTKVNNYEILSFTCKFKNFMYLNVEKGNKALFIYNKIYNQNNLTQLDTTK